MARHWHSREEIETALNYYKQGLTLEKVAELSGIKLCTFRVYITNKDRKIRASKGGLVRWRN